MEKLSQSFVSKITMLRKRLESFLDNDFDSNSEETERLQRDFEVSRDMGLIRGISQGLPDDHVDRAVVIFSRLALFFDAGVLLENNDSRWKAQAFFSKGITQLFNNSQKAYISIPQTNILEVLKTSSANMLEKLHLQHLDPEQKTTCLLVKVSPDYAFLFFSSMPDIWLKDHMDNIRRALANGIAD